MSAKSLTRLAIALLLILIGGSGRISAQSKNDVNAQITSTAATNAHLVSSLAADARAKLGTKVYEDTINTTRSVTSGPSIRQITRQALYAQSEHDFGLAVLKGNNVMINGAVGAATTLGTANPVLGMLVGQGVSASLDEVTKLYEKEGTEAIKRNLKTNLDQYLDRTSPQETAELLASPDPATFRTKLEAKVGKVFGTETRHPSK